MGSGPSKKTSPRIDCDVEKGLDGNSEDSNKNPSCADPSRTLPASYVRKADIFRVEEYVEIDKKAAKCPTDLLYKSFKDLADYLTEGSENDIQRVRACFTWLCSIDVVALQDTVEEMPEPGSPLDYLLKIQYRMANHSHVFAKVCRAAGLKCNVVTGLNKSADYEVGSNLEPDKLRAQWNVVQVDGEWRLCDIYWAMAYVKRRKPKEWALLAEDGALVESSDEEDKKSVKYMENSEDGNLRTFNEFYFLTDPDRLVCTHLPKDPQWQLLPNPFTEGHFEKYAYLRERFFELGMVVIDESHEKCIVKTKNGGAKIAFGLKKEISQLTEFKFHLYRAKNSSEEATPIEVPLDQYVFDQKTESKISYTVNFPVTGRFRLDLFGMNLMEHSSFELICAYIIDCPVATIQESADEPYDPKVEIRFHCDTDSFTVLQEIRINILSEILLKRYAAVRNEGEDIVFNLKLPPESMEAFRAFAEDPRPKGEETGEVHRYLLRVMEPGVYKDPYPELKGGVLGKTYLAALMGVKCKGEETDENKLIVIQDGKMELEFEVAEGVELVCQITHKSMKSEALKNTVQELDSGTQHSYIVDLPDKGEYGMIIYARYRDDKDRVYHVYTCMAQYEPEIDEFTDTIEEDKEEVKVETTVEETQVSETTQILEKRAAGMDLVGELTKHDSREEPVKFRLKTCPSSEQMFTVFLPDVGTYSLRTFGLEDGKLYPASVHSIVRNVEDIKEPTPEPEPEIDPEQEKKREQDLAECRELLNQAAENRELVPLEKAIDRTVKAGFEKELAEELRMARLILEQVQRVEKLRQAILNIDNFNLAEIKSYSVPPPEVYRVMAATFLFIGESYKNIRDWKSIKILIGKTGKSSFKRKIANLNLSAMDPELAKTAYMIYSQYTQEDIHIVSVGVEMFYNWATNTIDEVKARYEIAGGDWNGIRPNSSFRRI